MTRPTSPRILVLDNDPLSMTAIAAVLDSRGPEVYCARTVEAAIKAARQTSLDLVVIDPEGLSESGREILDRIRGEGISGEASAIIMRAPAAIQPEDPGVYYIAKPVDPNVLLELAEQAIWLPHLVNQRRSRGTRPARPGWITL